MQPQSTLKGYTFEAQNTQHVIYVGANRQIDELWVDGNGWHVNDLTVVASGSPVAPSLGTPLACYAFEKDYTQHVIYVSENHYVMELWWDKNGWHVNDLIVAAGSPASLRLDTPLVGYAFENQSTQHVLYVSMDNHVIELWWDKNGWHSKDLTAATGAPVPKAGTPLVGYAFENQMSQHVVYLTTQNHVMELWWYNNKWHYNDLTEAAKGPVPPKLDTPLVGYAFEKQNTQHIFYASMDNRVTEVWWDKNAWHKHDVSGSIGAPAPKVGSPLAGYAFENQDTQHVMYVTTDDRLMELWCDNNGWNANDLSLAAQAPPDRRPDTPLTAYAFENQMSQHVMYLTTNNHVMELWWHNNKWRYHDLTTATGSPLVWFPAA